MKKKEKGFTLVELLATVAILAIIVAVTVGVSLNVMDSAKKNANKVSLESIRTASSIFVDEYGTKRPWEPLQGNNQYLCLTINMMMTLGYFNEDSNVVHNKDLGLTLDNYVKIVRNKNTYKVLSRDIMYDTDSDCVTYFEKYPEDDFMNGVNNGEVIPSVDKTRPIINKVNLTEDGNSITATVDAFDNVGVTNYCYSLDNKDFKCIASNSYTFTGVKVGNYTVYVYATDKAENKSAVYSDSRITVTDKEAPVISNVTASVVSNNNIQINVNATDNVGVTQYCYSLDGGNYTCNSNSSYTFSNLGMGDYTIYVYTKDKAGNQSGIHNGTRVSVQDTEAPRLQNVTASVVSNNNIQISISATDNVGVTQYCYSLDGGNYTCHGNSSHTFSNLGAGTYRIYAYVSDARGNRSNIDSSKTLSIKSLQYYLNGGSYSPGQSVSWAGLNWYVIRDNGNSVSLVLKNNYSTGYFGGSNSFPGSYAYTIVNNNFVNNYSGVRNAINDGALVPIGQYAGGNYYVGLPGFNDLSSSIPNNSGTAFWTMTGAGSGVYVGGTNGNLQYNYYCSGGMATFYAGSKLEAADRWNGSTTAIASQHCAGLGSDQVINPTNTTVGTYTISYQFWGSTRVGVKYGTGNRYSICHQNYGITDWSVGGTSSVVYYGDSLGCEYRNHYDFSSIIIGYRPMVTVYKK